MRIIVGGMPRIRGGSMAAKKRYVSENCDCVRSALLHEPRGHKDMFGVVLTEPSHPDAELGMIFMDSGGYLNMCGHGIIGALTAAIEMGFIAGQEPSRRVVIDTPAGLVEATAQVRDDVVIAVTVRNAPSFVFASDVPIELPGRDCVSVDIAFGGNFVALVSAAQLGIAITPENSPLIIETGMRLLGQVNRSVKVSHPLERHINTVDLLEMFGEPRHPAADAQNVVVFGRGSLDRSPCGTGTCAKMAALHAKGKLRVMEEFTHESIIGTLFKGRIVGQTNVGEFEAIVPEITGNGFVIAVGQFIINPHDPLRDGFLMSA